MFFSHYNNHNSQRLLTREITIHKICNLNTVLNTKLSFVFNGYCNRTYMTVQVKPPTDLQQSNLLRCCQI